MALLIASIALEVAVAIVACLAALKGRPYLFGWPNCRKETRRRWPKRISRSPPPGLHLRRLCPLRSRPSARP